MKNYDLQLRELRNEVVRDIVEILEGYGDEEVFLKDDNCVLNSEHFVVESFVRDFGMWSVFVIDLSYSRRVEYYLNDLSYDVLVELYVRLNK